MCFSPQRRTIFRHQNVQKWSRSLSFLTCSLPNVLFAAAVYKFSTSELQKVLRNWRVLYILTSKCAFRHSGVQFFDIRTSKSGPGPAVFEHFHFRMRFSPQRRTIFDILTSKSAPRPSVFEHFHFKMCFSPQQRAIFDFSSEQLPPHPPL